MSENHYHEDIADIRKQITEVARTLSSLAISVAQVQTIIGAGPLNCSLHGEKLKSIRRELDEVHAVTQKLSHLQSRLIGAMAVVVVVINLITVVYGPTIRQAVGLENHQSEKR